jgi:hypothetical protein
MHSSSPPFVLMLNSKRMRKYTQNKMRYLLTKICPFPGYWTTDSSPFFTSLLFSGRTLQKEQGQKQSIMLPYYNSKSVTNTRAADGAVMQCSYISDYRFMWPSHPEHTFTGTLLRITGYFIMFTTISKHTIKTLSVKSFYLVY